MKCYFLRHGIAADPAEWTGEDFDRPLTGQGRERMEREAETLAELSLDLAAIITSPLLRAKQTASIVAERLRMTDRLVEDDRLSPGFDLDRLGAILQAYARADAVMLVGHEPSMSETVGRLVGAARIDLKKGGLACVDLPDPSSSSGQLAWLIPPKILTCKIKARS